MPKKIDLTGKVFGRLRVIQDSGERRTVDKVIMWRCKCDCGNIVFIDGKSLRRGDTKSCGCLNKEKSRKRIIQLNKSGIHINNKYGVTHGHASVGGKSSPTYNSWFGIIQRCENKNNKDYKNYGGRGITVCEQWHRFENFLKDMGIRPPLLSIDRINNDAGYSPDNCRWATPSQQNLNRRSFNSGRRKKK